MKKILSASLIIALIAFAGTASAQAPPDSLNPYDLTGQVQNSMLDYYIGVEGSTGAATADDATIADVMNPWYGDSVSVTGLGWDYSYYSWNAAQALEWGFEDSIGGSAYPLINEYASWGLITTTQAIYFNQISNLVDALSAGYVDTGTFVANLAGIESDILLHEPDTMLVKPLCVLAAVRASYYYWSTQFADPPPVHTIGQLTVAALQGSFFGAVFDSYTGLELGVGLFTYTHFSCPIPTDTEVAISASIIAAQTVAACARKFLPGTWINNGNVATFPGSECGGGSGGGGGGDTIPESGGPPDTTYASTPGRVLVADTVFTLGGLTFGLTGDPVLWNDSLPKFGLNTVFYGGGSGTTPYLTPGLTGYPKETSYFDRYFFGAGTPPDLAEKDINLASNEDSAAAWDLYQNWTITPVGHLTNGEWSILSTDPGSTYLQANAIPFTVPGQTIFIDFVYRIDPTRYSGNSDGDSLFDIHYTANISGTSCTSQTGDAYVTKGGFNAFSTSSFGISEYQYSKSIVQFPSLLHFPPVAAQSYAVKRIEIDIPDSCTLNSVDFSLLKTTYSNGIIVRGVRIRTQGEDKLLRGVYDNTNPPNGLSLDSTFIKIKNDLGTATWSRTRVIAAGNEIESGSYRTYAYINEKWRAFSKAHGGQQKDIECIIAQRDHGTYRWYRALYEDQSNGVPPPPLQAEDGINQFNVGYRTHNAPRLYVMDTDIDVHTIGTPCGPVFPGDAIPSAIKNHANFKELNLLISGWNASTGKYEQTPIGTPTTIYDSIRLNSYAGYTQWYQLIMGTTTAGITDKSYLAQYYDAAKNCYPKDKPSLWTSFYAYPSVIAGTDRTVNSDTISGYLQSKIYAALKMHHVPCKLSYNEAEPSGRFDPELQTEFNPTTQWETREQTWHALAWGAKGIIYNPIGDAAANMGFCGSNFQHQAQSGLSGIGALGDTNYEYFGIWYLPGNGYIIPPATPLYHDTDKTFPDHYVHYVHDTIEIVGADTIPRDTNYQIWVPVLSDFDIYNGPHTDSTKILSKDSVIDSHHIDAYIKAMQHSSSTSSSWTVPGASSDLITYYSGLPNTGWKAEHLGGSDAQHPDSAAGDVNKDDSVHNIYFSDWLAFDRNLDSTYPGHKDSAWSPWWGPGIFYPQGSVQLGLKGVPTYYGVKERADGVIRSTSDIIPIAAELKKLRWDTTSNLAAGVPSFFPFTVSSSQKMKRFTYPLTPKTTDDDGLGLTDDSDEMFYNIGKFTDPDDPGAIYLIINNSRTWPVIYNPDHSVDSVDNSSGTSTPLLGAIDCRRLKLQLKSNWANWSSSGIADYTITNLRTGQQVTGHTASPGIDSIDFDPGEGMLLRVAPLASVVAGRTGNTGMAYNNGHRLVELTNSDDEYTGMKVMTWERNGKIYYAVINDSTHNDGSLTHLSGVDNDISNVHELPSDGITDSHYYARNPSIAANCTDDAYGKVVAITYSVDETDGRQVMVALSKYPFTSWKFAYVPDTTVLIPYGSGGLDSVHLATPVITSLAHAFGVAYSMPYNDSAWTPTSNAQFVFMPYDTTPKFTVTPPYSPIPAALASGANVIAKTFPTLASIVDYGDSEYVHLSWEEDRSDSTSAIYYRKGSHTLGSGSFAWDSLEQVSRGLPQCNHRHPSITVNVQESIGGDDGVVAWGQPTVTWEEYSPRCIGGSLNQMVSVLIRPRINGVWSSIVRLYPKLNNLPLPMIRAQTDDGWFGFIFPHDDWQDVFQDTFVKQVHIARLNPLPSGSFQDTVHHSRLNDYAQYPNISDASSGNPFKDYTFRDILVDTAGLYGARINTYESASKEETTIGQMLIQNVTIKPSSSDCNAIHVQFSEASIGCSGCGLPESYSDNDTAVINPDSGARRAIRWKYHPVDDIMVAGTPKPLSDSSYLPPDSIRSNYFQVNSGETLSVPGIVDADPSLLSSLFTHSWQSVEVDVLMKDSASHATLDTVIKMQLNPLSWAAPWWSDTCGAVHIVPPQSAGTPPSPTSGKAYLTLRIVADTSTHVSLVHGQTFTSGLFIPDSASTYAEKRSNPTATSPAPAPFEFTVHPNPAQHSALVEIGLTKDDPTRIEVLDIMGAEMKVLYDGVPASTETETLTLDAQKLAAGHYFIRAVCGNAIKTVKLEVVK